MLERLMQAREQQLFFFRACVASESLEVTWMISRGVNVQRRKGEHLPHGSLPVARVSLVLASS